MGRWTRLERFCAILYPVPTLGCVVVQLLLKHQDVHTFSASDLLQLQRFVAGGLKTPEMLSPVVQVVPTGFSASFILLATISINSGSKGHIHYYTLPPGFLYIFGKQQLRITQRCERQTTALQFEDVCHKYNLHGFVGDIGSHRRRADCNDSDDSHHGRSHFIESARAGTETSFRFPPQTSKYVYPAIQAFQSQTLLFASTLVAFLLSNRRHLQAQSVPIAPGLVAS